jgi:hypothetical protein
VPPLIRRYIKTSFVFLVAGLVLGGYIMVSEFVVGVYPPRLFVTAHVHLLAGRLHAHARLRGRHVDVPAPCP